ncbi:bestrophin-like domain [Nocardia sp. NBC_00403]|uniref:bestrophin-like domain n=1 Tax=Nocardia sp. NBC_00403 TaxID=2975990 RepID=UPI002E1A2E42
MARELIVAIGVTALAVLVFVLGDRLRPDSWRQTGDEAAGTLVFDLIKTFFAATVAFVVIICWQQYQTARSYTVAEAKSLVDTYTAAHAMPDPEHHRIQGLVRDYTTQVVDQEWSMMDRDGHLSQKAQGTLDVLRDSVDSMRSSDPYVNNLRATTLASLDRVAGARHDRALVVGYGIPGFLYVALYFGTLLLLLSPVLSGVRVTRRSVLMMVLLGVVVGAAILEVHNLDQPFSGGNTVPRDAFELALARFQQIT